jgi:phosphocarrier protein
VSLSRTVDIINERGLHARASAKFVKLASGFDAEIHVTRDGVTVNALSIMGLLMLGAGNGSTIDISAEGADTPHRCALPVVTGERNLKPGRAAGRLPGHRRDRDLRHVRDRPAKGVRLVRRLRGP